MSESTLTQSDKISSVREYVEEAKSNPRLRRKAAEYISDTIDYYGKEKVFEGLYGTVWEKIDELIDIIDDAAEDGALKDRGIMLVGPPGSGKSEVVDKLKYAIESYSLTDEGEIYAVKGCRVHHNPLSHVSEEDREELLKDGLKWDKFENACPRCKKYGNLYDMEVERIYLSEQGKIGIGKHHSTDTKTEDVTLLIGDVDPKGVEKTGSFADPESHDFMGKLIYANRGLMDWTEMLKSKKKIIPILNELIQSQIVDLPRLEPVYIDTLVLGHTNVPEYEEYADDPYFDATRSRFHKIYWPYNLDPEAEMKIYAVVLDRKEKSRERKSGKKEKIHANPDVLELAANFTVQTRENEVWEGVKGMDGVDIRVMQNIISLSVGKEDNCLNFNNFVARFEPEFDKAYNQEKKDKWLPYFEEEVEKYYERCKGKLSEVIAKISDESKEMGEELYQKYIEEVKKWSSSKNYLGDDGLPVDVRKFYGIEYAGDEEERDNAMGDVNLNFL
ncbi:MAG: hypothetical protein KAU95_02810, partial [Candidatus Aenigmarchaeota archaeon]|nr:hypothetical protein [Candidatus Aenigmarchaeota archaeon]